MPVWREEGTSVAYKQIYEKKLFVTRGEVARYVFLPAMTGFEESVAVSSGGRVTDRSYQVTYTKATENLWSCVPGTAPPVLDWRRVKIIRHDAPISQPTALKIHQLWIARLQKIKQPPRGEIRLDSSSQIFSAVTDNGFLMRAETYDFGQKNVMLIKLAVDLINYCTIPPSDRADAAAQIEKKATALLRMSRD